MKARSSHWLVPAFCVVAGEALWILRPQEAVQTVVVPVAPSPSSWKSEAETAGMNWLARGVRLQGSVIAPAQEEEDVVTFSADGKRLVGSVGDSSGRPLFHSWDARTGALIPTVGPRFKRHGIKTGSSVPTATLSSFPGTTFCASTTKAAWFNRVSAKERRGGWDVGRCCLVRRR